MQMVPRNITAPFGCPAAYIYHLNRFSAAIEAFGVEACGAEGLSHGRRGLRLSLCSGTNEFEILLDNSRVKLGMIRMDDGQRVPLAEGGAASQAVWDRFVQVVKQSEGR